MNKIEKLKQKFSTSLSFERFGLFGRCDLNFSQYIFLYIIFKNVCLSFCLSVCLSVFLSVCLSFCLSVCLSVWTFIGSVPGPDTVMRPVSLEPVWPGGGPLRNNFPEKWPVAKLPNKMLRHWAFQWGFFCPVHYERGALSSY
jgi:hypothetical protein